MELRKRKDKKKEELTSELMGHKRKNKTKNTHISIEDNPSTVHAFLENSRRPRGSGCLEPISIKGFTPSVHPITFMFENVPSTNDMWNALEIDVSRMRGG